MADSIKLLLSLKTEDLSSSDMPEFRAAVIFTADILYVMGPEIIFTKYLLIQTTNKC